MPKASKAVTAIGLVIEVPVYSTPEKYSFALHFFLDLVSNVLYSIAILFVGLLPSEVL